MRIWPIKKRKYNKICSWLLSSPVLLESWHTKAHPNKWGRSPSRMVRGWLISVPELSSHWVHRLVWFPSTLVNSLSWSKPGNIMPLLRYCSGLLLLILVKDGCMSLMSSSPPPLCNKYYLNYWPAKGGTPKVHNFIPRWAKLAHTFFWPTSGCCLVDSAIFSIQQNIPRSCPKSGKETPLKMS